MTQSLRKVYVALFISIFVLLFGWSLRSIPDYQTPQGISVIDGKWAKSFETHFDKEFPVKRLGTNVWAAIDYLAFGEGRPGVIVGRENWLFSDEEVHTVAHAERNTAENWALIRGVRKELEAHGITLVLAILPAKARVYPEYLGRERPGSAMLPLYQRFHAEADKAGLIAPDLLAPLQDAKQGGSQVFLRTDTHWTPAGAEVVARQLGERIRSARLLQEPPRRYVTQPGAVREHQGDLVAFLPLDPLFSALLPAPDQLQMRSTQPLEQGSGEDALFGEVKVPVTLIGTSYSADPRWNFVGALRESLQADVVSHAEDGRGPILPMLTFLQTASLEQSKPSVVIWEFPERYLPVANDLSSFDPQWLARLTQASANDQRVAQRTHAHPPVTRETN